MDPLIPAIKKNLEHRHYYVRANAVLSLHSVHKSFPDMVSDAPELLESFLDGETDRTARRNAFLCLFHMDHRRATSFLLDNWEQVLGRLHVWICVDVYAVGVDARFVYVCAYLLWIWILLGCVCMHAFVCSTRC